MKITVNEKLKTEGYVPSDSKPVRRGSLQDRVNDKLKSLSVEELAKLLGV